MEVATGTLSNMPIRQKLMLAIVGTSFIAVFICSIVYIGFGWFSSRERIHNELKISAVIFAQNIAPALSFGDVAVTDDLLASLSAVPEVELACIYQKGFVENTGSTQFASFTSDGTKVICPVELPLVALTNLNFVEVIAPIELGVDVIGHIYMRRGVSDLWAATQLNVTVVALMVLISIVLAVAISSILQELIAGPIQNLVDTTRLVSDNKDFSLRAEKITNDEVGVLIDSFNNMLERIERRDDALQTARTELEFRIGESERANTELNEAMRKLRTTQEQLVNTEKMASLGALVAGVAHEINTPIGVGVTAASTLKLTTEELSSDYEEGKLTNSGLKKYIGSAVQTTQIILSNLNRAAELIHSFKQVAVDQSSSERRRFNLKTYLDEVLLSLRPKWKKTKVDVSVECSDMLEVDSYPGAVSQIITNLLMNSLTHAYDEGESGKITIDVDSSGEEVLLTYRDDGKGIPPENLQKVFDPFFTTRRGQGGSGLGMHIVYNLVTQQLQGEVSINSKLGYGVEVFIRFPGVVSAERVNVG